MWKSRHARGIVAAGLLVLFVCAAGLRAESSADDELLKIVPAESLFCMCVNNFEYTVRMIDQFLAGSSSMPMAQMDIPTKSNIAFAGNAGNGRMVVDIAVPKEHLMETMAAALVMQQQMIKQQQKKVMMQQKQQRKPNSPRSSGIESIPETDMTWVKCANKDCKAGYQMGKRAYFKYIQEHIDPMAMVAPPLICKKCGKKSIYRAEKCGSLDCGIVFLRGSVPNDFADRCPACGNSNTEDQRKRRRAGGLRR